MRAGMPSRQTSRGKHDDFGIATFSDTTTCGENEKIVNRVCTTCPPGTPALATKMPLVSKPRPRQYLAYKCERGEQREGRMSSWKDQQWRPRCQRHFVRRNILRCKGESGEPCVHGVPSREDQHGKHYDSGTDTVCDATTCGENDKAVNPKCAARPPGKTSLFRPRCL